MRNFVRIDLGTKPVLDETTVCRVRHLLETHPLGPTCFERVNAHLRTQGLTVSMGIIVDSTISHV